MNKMTKLAGLLVGLAQFTAVGAAHADVVTFDGNPEVYTSSPIVRDGFSFSPSAGILHTITNRTDYGSSNGGNYLAFQANGTNHETFSMVGNTPFILTSIDLGGWDNFGSVNQSLTITGFHPDATSVTTLLNIAPTTFATYALSGFTNLESVQLGWLTCNACTSRGYVAVDNIVTTPVPEPETYAMLLAGLGLLAVAARRRRAS